MKSRILLIAGGVFCLCLPRTGAASTAIASCQEITRPGSYVLTLDLTDSTGQSCVRIHDVSNVSLDCDGHSIVTSGNAAVSLDNVKNYSVQKCSLQTQWTAALSITNSTGGQVGNNIFGDSAPAQFAIPAVSLVHVSGLNFSSNQVYGAYQQYQGSGATVSGNNFLSALNGSGNQGAAMVLL